MPGHMHRDPDSIQTGSSRPSAHNEFNVLHLPEDVLHMLGCACDTNTRWNLRLTCQSFRKAVQPTAIKIAGDWISEQRQRLKHSQGLATAWNEVSSAHIVRWQMENSTTIKDFYLSNIATALQHWTQLQSVLAPWSVPIVTTLVTHCSQLLSLHLTDMPYNRHYLCMPLSYKTHKQLRMSTHIGLSLEAISASTTLRKVQLEMVYTNFLPVHCWSLSCLTRLDSLQVRLADDGDMTTESTLSMADLNVAVSNLTALTELRLEVERATNNDHLRLYNLKSLRALHLSIHTPVTKLSCPSITACTQLTKLKLLNSCKLSMSAVCSSLHQIIDLEVDMDITDPEAAALSRFPHLTSLKAGTLSLQSGCSGSIWPQLRKLWVSHLYSGLPFLHLAPRLQSLRVDFDYDISFIMGDSMASVHGHLHLKNLQLPGKLMRDPYADIDTLSTITSLTSLVVDSPSHWPELEPCVLPLKAGLLTALRELSLGLDYLEELHRVQAAAPNVEILRLAYKTPVLYPVVADSRPKALVTAAASMSKWEKLKCVELEVSWMKAYLFKKWKDPTREGLAGGRAHGLTHFLLGLIGCKSLATVRLWHQQGFTNEREVLDHLVFPAIIHQVKAAKACTALPFDVDMV